mgnify:CR=1 FL=1
MIDRTLTSDEMKIINNVFINNNPFPHVILKKLFSDSCLMAVNEEIATFTNWNIYKQKYYSREKFCCNNMKQLPVNTRKFIEFLNSKKFISFLATLSDIPNLIADPYLIGGGIHCIKRGGFLKVHSDFNFHKILKLHRRLNVLIYLNKNWNSDWGGHLELWNKTVSKCVKQVAPKFNTMVVFSTTNNSYHGHPDPLNCPEDVTRNSIAMYYYTKTRPESELVTPGVGGRKGKNSTTAYVLRPENDEDMLSLSKKNP